MADNKNFLNRPVTIGGLLVMLLLAGVLCFVKHWYPNAGIAFPLSNFTFVGTVVEIKTSDASPNGTSLAGVNVLCFVAATNKVPTGSVTTPSSPSTTAAAGSVTTTQLSPRTLYKVIAKKEGYATSVFYIRDQDKVTNSSSTPAKVRIYSSNLSAADGGGPRLSSALRVWVYNSDMTPLAGAKVSIVDQANRVDFANVQESATSQNKGAAVFDGIAIGSTITYTINVYKNAADSAAQKPFDTYTINTSGLTSGVNDISTYSIAP